MAPELSLGDQKSSPQGRRPPHRFIGLNQPLCSADPNHCETCFSPAQPT